jgi:hypothetical protein
MNQDAAETLALRALGWLAGQSDVLGQFMTATGANVSSIADAVGQPSFLAAVLDFMLSEEDRLIAFCDAEGVDYALPMKARAVLPGGQQTHWT